MSGHVGLYKRGSRSLTTTHHLVYYTCAMHPKLDRILRPLGCRSDSILPGIATPIGSGETQQPKYKTSKVGTSKASRVNPFACGPGVNNTLQCMCEAYRQTFIGAPSPTAAKRRTAKTILLHNVRYTTLMAPCVCTLDVQGAGWRMTCSDKTR